MITPGDYNIEHNTKIALKQFEKYGHIDFVCNLIIKIIFMIAFILLVFFLTKMALLVIKEYLLDVEKKAEYVKELKERKW